MPRFLLHAAGRDRPGIVAGVAGVLADLGGNLEDSRMTILQGQFAIMLVVELAEGLSAAAIEERLASVAAAFELRVAVVPIDEGSDGLPSGTLAAVSVHGADHPGIVARIAEAIADSGGNVVDLATRVLVEPAGRSYVMVLSVALPESESLDGLDRLLRPVAEELGVHCGVTPGDADLF